MQHTSLTPDKELNNLIYGMLLYIDIYGGYKLVKKQSVLGPPLYYKYMSPEKQATFIILIQSSC